jgi:hypothetical protein
LAQNLDFRLRANDDREWIGSVIPIL